MESQRIHAVCLDAYGTLCRIGDRRHPYLSLFRLLGVDPLAAARQAMTTPVGIEELARLLAPNREADLSRIAADLEAEVTSVTLYEDAAEALARIRRLGLKTWVASNLAPPYAAPLRSSLASLVDGFCLSFEIGTVKPERVFFERLCSDIGCRAGLALMVGDSLRSDVEGAVATGMRAIHLARGPARPRPDGVRSLAELADLLSSGRSSDVR